MEGVVSPEFWEGRRVLVTGHTGFKGAWLLALLETLGAKVSGLALPPRDRPNLYDLLSPWHHDSHLGDIRDHNTIEAAVQAPLNHWCVPATPTR